MKIIMPHEVQILIINKLFNDNLFNSRYNLHQQFSQLQQPLHSQSLL
jgi:hypothetical protein